MTSNLDLNLPDQALPPTCAVAFKEWDGVCRALMVGDQSLILRKGGVAEEAGEFRPEHPAFWLFPTIVHQAEQGLRTPPRSVDLDPGVVAIEALAVVAWTARVDRLDQLDALRPFHDWTEATIRQRFAYRRPGLWALVVRVYRRVEPIVVTVTAEQLGCKTWVPLDLALPSDGLVPVLDTESASQRRAEIRQALEAVG